MTELEELQRRIELKDQFIDILHEQIEKTELEVMELRSAARNLRNGKEEKQTA